MSPIQPCRIPAGRRIPLLVALLVLGTLSSLQGCAALREVAGVRQLQFTLDRVSDVRVAGVDVEGARQYEALGAADLGRIGLAWAEGQLPVSLTLHVSARNPADNVRARLTALDWTLLLRDRETVSGELTDEVAVEPGEAVEIPVRAELDLVRFFDGGMRDLVETALALAGAGGEPSELQLRVTPTVGTPLGPIRYETPVVLGGRR